MRCSCIALDVRRGAPGDISSLRRQVRRCCNGGEPESANPSCGSSHVTQSELVLWLEGNTSTFTHKTIAVFRQWKSLTERWPHPSLSTTPVLWTLTSLV
ncbi:hypothetical protein AMECASPLE_021266 [Ameca splendens]|uniref:Uncharacterized protein n=1 Tax=Ameca splendens TaxID=208324 RepID=A0ABV0ZDC5_9TELE